MVNLLRFRYIVFAISVSRIADLVKRFLARYILIQAFKYDKRLSEVVLIWYEYVFAFSAPSAFISTFWIHEHSSHLRCHHTRRHGFTYRQAVKHLEDTTIWAHSRHILHLITAWRCHAYLRHIFLDLFAWNSAPAKIYENKLFENVWFSRKYEIYTESPQLFCWLILFSHLKMNSAVFRTPHSVRVLGHFSRHAPILAGASVCARTHYA